MRWSDSCRLEDILTHRPMAEFYGPYEYGSSAPTRHDLECRSFPAKMIPPVFDQAIPSEVAENPNAVVLLHQRIEWSGYRIEIPFLFDALLAIEVPLKDRDRVFWDAGWVTGGFAEPEDEVHLIEGTHLQIEALYNRFALSTPLGSRNGPTTVDLYGVIFGGSEPSHWEPSCCVNRLYCPKWIITRFGGRNLHHGNGMISFCDFFDADPLPPLSPTLPVPFAPPPIESPLDDDGRPSEPITL